MPVCVLRRSILFICRKRLTTLRSSGIIADMYHVTGGCHCGNIRVDVKLTAAPDRHRPRACDCDFCRKHLAAYVSDPQGTLVIRIEDERERSTYRQGSGRAEFLLCRNCGVLVGALHRDGARICATVNVRALPGTAFGSEQVASPQSLAADQKVKRWQDIWFADVELISPVGLPT